MLEAYRAAALAMLSATLATLSPTLHAESKESQCFGTVSRGRIENAVKLPSSGPNFTSYSNLATMAGRTYVHSKVADVIVSAYAALATAHPSIHYVYGETGLAKGGLFRPHRTHQNGTSVDFFVPVRDREGKSVALPTNVTNKFGYNIEFDAQGVFGEYTIDFEATGEHLYQLHEIAKSRGIGIALVIFDESYLPKLFATRRGPYLKRTLPFMKGKPWVRHDEHYHVDFAVPCKAEARAG
jgi:penicillin-insensitive murein DD-endopeptidase